MIGEIKIAALSAGGGLVAMFLAAMPTDATQWYWIAEKFGFLGLTVFGLGFAAWFVAPKIAEKLFAYLDRLEARNEASRQDFLVELRAERTTRENNSAELKNLLIVFLKWLKF
jgi:hypothetical protein